MTEPRIRPTEPPFSEAIATAMSRVLPEGVPPLALFRTIAVNERVLLRMFAGSLLDRGSISLREREIVIERTCFRCGSEYEWGVHVAFFGTRAGLSPEQLRAICSNEPNETSLPPRDRLLIRLCDELHDTANVSDALWGAVAAEWSPEQLVELVILIGYYHAISFATNAFRVPLESFGARFADVT
jgi:alkylhydroperoxidase family enzyme